MPKTKFHQYARLCAKAMDWSIFPLRPRDKRPLTKHGFKDASASLEQIDRWWMANSRAGIGIPTGKVNGLIVIDFDPRNAGGEEVDNDGVTHYRDAWDMASEFFGAESVPETWTVETPGGGLHFYFQHPGERVVPGIKGWKNGVDIKSDGGYVCAPPSIHPNGGEYIWATPPTGDVVLAEMPETVLSEMAEKQRERVSKEIAGTLGDGKVPAGTRNDYLTSVAGTLQRRNIDPEAILAALLAENNAKCEPPLDEDEIVAIVTSVSRYEPDEDSTPQLVASKARGLELDSMSELLSEPPPVQWLLEGRLARGDCAIIVGPPGSGKSWITLDLAISGALGLPILGHWHLEKPLKVMYIDEENPRDEVNRRMHAIFNATVQNGERAKARLDLEARLFPYRACQGFTFREKDGYIQSLTQHVSQIEPDLIIFDSMTAVSGILDENKATEIRAFFHDKLYPLRRICNSAILCVHHSNKRAYETEGNESVTQDGQIRGSIDYLAAVDACLFATAVKSKETGQVTKRMLKQTKQRRNAEPPGVEWDLVGTRDSVDGLEAVRPLVVDAKPAEASGAAFASFVSEVAVKAGFECLSKSGLVKWAKEHMKTPSPTPAMILEFIESRTGRMDVTEGDIR